MALNTLHNDDATLNKIMFIDEAWFYKRGYVNSQNMQTWSAENPHFFLHPQKLGVWIAETNRTTFL
jgi:uncharacterized protein YpiB (UPF0302 family)